MKKGFKAGIAMIELIFAIVVMGITLLSVPMLLTVVGKSSIVSFQQEAIAIAASHTNALMTYAWDEQNTDTLALYIQNPLHANGATLLTEGGRPTFSYPAARRRDFAVGGAATLLLGDDTNLSLVDTLDDVDDFNDQPPIGLIIAVSGGTVNDVDEGAYIDANISINTQVRYGDDTATYDSGTGVFAFSDPLSSATMTNTTNIKLITTQLTSSSLSDELNDKQINLNAFMCNIGTNNPITRSGY